MKLKKPKMLEIEKNSKFSERVLVLSAPAAVVFTMLTMFDFLSPLSAVLSYLAIVIFNLIFLSPLTLELQRLKTYINNLSEGDYNQAVKLSDNEAQEIAEAVRSLHYFFVAKIDALEAKAMSDTAVLDTLPDPIIMIDRSGNVLGANHAASLLFGTHITEQTIEKTISSQTFIEAVRKVLKEESESESLVFSAPAPISKKLYTHIKKLPWLSKGRAMAVISLYDLTKALKIEKMQSDFVANASHELRTPLSVISGFIETLQTSAKDDETAREQFLSIMAEQASFMSALIENLLSLSKIEMSQDTPPTTKADLSKVIVEVVDALAFKAKSRDMQIVVEKPKRLSKIVADESQIKQLIQNLTDNAIKYGLSQSEIKISVKPADKIPPSKSFNVAEGKAVAVSINNKGPKISPQDLARLTERFYRLQEHKDLGIKGTGLGLSIAKQIIMRHKGNLTVSSNTANGITFTVYLPVELK
ncbi:MAG: PAS domain-containing protein [Alphaproteobacteria bacterium]|nr:PAS domain-containing protein [Alphaproteobacteria bacterium]